MRAKFKSVDIYEVCMTTISIHSKQWALLSLSFLYFIPEISDKMLDMGYRNLAEFLVLLMDQPIIPFYIKF